MTKARILRTASLDTLRSEVKSHIERYRSGDFSYLEVDSSHYRELDCSIDHAALGKLKTPKDTNLFEVENCIIVSDALAELSPYEARDERLWAYLTHTSLLEYARKRWPIPENDAEAVTHILKHFYARDKRQVERDNAVSRLWWMGHLCQRVNGLGIEKALNAFLYKSDVRANIIERPTSSQSVALFSAILKKLYKSMQGEKTLFERSTFRSLMTYINSVGGFKLLDFLDDKSADDLLESIIKEKMSLSKL